MAEVRWRYMWCAALLISWLAILNLPPVNEIRYVLILSDSAKSIVVLSFFDKVVCKFPFEMASHCSGITKLSLKELLNQVDQNKGNRVWLCRAQTECTSNRRIFWVLRYRQLKKCRCYFCLLLMPLQELWCAPFGNWWQPVFRLLQCCVFNFAVL